MRDDRARRLSIAIVAAAALSSLALVAGVGGPDVPAILDASARPSAGDTPPRLLPEPRALDDLGAWSFIDLVRDGRERIALLVAQAPVAGDRFYTLPNEGRFPDREVRLAVISGRAVRSARIDIVAVSTGDDSIWNGALLVAQGEVRCFVNYRAFDAAEWGSDGALYTLDRRTLALRAKTMLFQNENRGLSPFFEGDDLVHFASDGHFEWRGERRGARADSVRFEQRRTALLRERTDGLLPGASEEVVRRLAAGW